MRSVVVTRLCGFGLWVLLAGCSFLASRDADRGGGAEGERDAREGGRGGDE
jgi:hypothetical protein